MKLVDDLDLEQIMANTHDCTGPDLASLCSEAVMLQMHEKMALIDLDEDSAIRSSITLGTIVSQSDAMPLDSSTQRGKRWMRYLLIKDTTFERCVRMVDGSTRHSSPNYTPLCSTRGTLTSKL